MNAIPTQRPLPERLLRAFFAWFHDRAERMAIENRLISLAALEEEVRTQVEQLRADAFLGSADEMASRAMQRRQRGEELDLYRNEALRLRQRLALLDAWN